MTAAKHNVMRGAQKQDPRIPQHKNAYVQPDIQPPVDRHPRLHRTPGWSSTIAGLKSCADKASPGLGFSRTVLPDSNVLGAHARPQGVGAWTGSQAQGGDRSQNFESSAYANPRFYVQNASSSLPRFEDDLAIASHSTSLVPPSLRPAVAFGPVQRKRVAESEDNEASVKRARMSPPYGMSIEGVCFPSTYDPAAH